MIGAVLALVSFFIILFLLSINLVIGIKNPYLGIVLYMVLPAFLVLGLLLIPAGMYARWRRLQGQGKIGHEKWPAIDLNKRSHRTSFVIFVSGTLLFILVSAVGMYQAYRYTDSVAFCGRTCHTVMKPEYTTYQQSPHARVKCAECHIGPGVGWYAKSKLSGLYQVYAVIANVYPRPIPTPISSLRPARVTCEQCHWPGQFFGAMQRRFDHYRYDKQNTRWLLNMLLRVGSGSAMTAGKSGIHWHVGHDITIEYIARDIRRQDIPWVRVTDIRTGTVKVFQDKEKPLSENEIAAAVPRIMDCMDCHNRPSHNLQSPDYEIDRELSFGRIDGSLPDIKSEAVEAMRGDYRSDAEAVKGIETTMTDFYRKNYPEIIEARKEAIADAVKAVQRAFLKNVFPGMNAKWSDYPNDIGHFIFRGCMRCHDGRHRTAGGSAIPHDCHTCHIILEQWKEGPTETLNLERGEDFRHPVDIGFAWKEMGCYECHRGVQP